MSAAWADGVNPAGGRISHADVTGGPKSEVRATAIAVAKI